MSPLASEEASARERILEAIRRFPGIHFRGITKDLGLSTALLRYHLQALLEERKVRAVEVGGFVRYFPTETYRELSPRERAMLNLLRQARPLEIVLTLLEYGSMQHRDLLEMMGGSKGTLTYHLDKLVRAGIVAKVPKGEEKGFSLRDPDEVRALLARYEPVPEVLRQVDELWDDLFSGHRKRRER